MALQIACAQAAELLLALATMCVFAQATRLLLAPATTLAHDREMETVFATARVTRVVFAPLLAQATVLAMVSVTEGVKEKVMELAHSPPPPLPPALWDHMRWEQISPHSHHQDLCSPRLRVRHQHL